MSEVLMKLTVHARGLMATKLLEAADELDLPRSVIRSQTEGFRVPVEVHRHLFPSEYDAEGNPVETTPPAVVVEAPPASETGDQAPPPASDPAEDFDLIGNNGTPPAAIQDL